MSWNQIKTKILSVLLFFKAILFGGFVRRKWKFIYRMIVGTCELQRLLADDSVVRFDNYLRQSKALSNIRERIKSECSDTESRRRLVKDIVDIKPTLRNDENGKQALSLMLSRWKNVSNSKAYLEELRNVKYDPKNNQHEEQLLHLWSLLMPNEKLTGRLSRQWIDIGFQGEDPATDFRGGGYLGLLNLLDFTERYHARALEALKVSQNPQSSYFFCSAGIGITLHLIWIIRTGKLDDLLSSCESQEDALKRFGDIYSTLFMKFNNRWVATKANFMQFNTELEAFFRHAKEQSLHYFVA